VKHFLLDSFIQTIKTLADKDKLALFCHGIYKSPSLVDQTVVTALPSSMSYVPLTCSKGVFLYDGNKVNYVKKIPATKFLKWIFISIKKPVDVHSAVCTATHQPEMSKVFEPCSPFGGDGRTTGLDQLFTAQIAWNISGKWKEQVGITGKDLFFFLQQ